MGFRVPSGPKKVKNVPHETKGSPLWGKKFLKFFFWQYWYLWIPFDKLIPKRCDTWVKIQISAYFLAQKQIWG